MRSSLPECAVVHSFLSEGASVSSSLPEGASVRSSVPEDAGVRSSLPTSAGWVRMSTLQSFVHYSVLFVQGNAVVGVAVQQAVGRQTAQQQFICPSLVMFRA